MMNREISKNVYLFISATAIYVFFIIRGLPNSHHLEWSVYSQIGDCLEIIIFSLPVGYILLKCFSNAEDYFRDSIWLAFFTSVPFLIYDSLYLGVAKGFGITYLSEFWYLTIFYFIVWVEFPIIGYLMQKDDPKIVKKHFVMLSVAIIGWILNWWLGVHSNHYLEWALNNKIIRLTNIVLMLLPIVYYVLKFHSSKEEYTKDVVVLALYLSFVFILFDFFYLGISKDIGLRYIWDYWFVTLFYPIFWIEIPLIGWAVRCAKDNSNL